MLCRDSPSAAKRKRIKLRTESLTGHYVDAGIKPIVIITLGAKDGAPPQRFFP